jgi:hypothetical protein
MVEKGSAIASSPWVAIVGAGAALANPGGFIPVALKDISQLDPSAGGFIALWVAFTTLALLPLIAALILLTFRREWAMKVLGGAHTWLLHNAMRLGAVLVSIIGVVLVRNGIAGLT